MKRYGAGKNSGNRYTGTGQNSQGAYGRGVGEMDAESPGGGCTYVGNKGISTARHLEVGSTIRFGHESAASDP